jgi:hypothetical protein
MAKSVTSAGAHLCGPCARRTGLNSPRAFEATLVSIPTIQLRKEQAIAVVELDAAVNLALQHNQLTPERGILRLKSAVRLER